MEEKSFGDIYYQLYTDDLPVFVTADSILHACHRSFDACLVKIEEGCLASTLDTILDNTLLVCEEMATRTSKYQSNVAKSVGDVEDYLTIGLSLLGGELVSESERLRTLWSAIQAEKAANVEVLSAPRTIDFSQFKPRGHYTKSEKLKNYFRAMMWLGTIDLRIASGDSESNDLHQLLCAVILTHCLRESDSIVSVEEIDSLISSLASDSDLGAESVPVNELVRFISAETTKLLLETPDDEDIHSLLLDLQQEIVQKSPKLSTEATATTSVALFGQRFVWSAFIFSRLVYDQVIHDGRKQKRRIPSAVDVAFTLFANNEAGQVLSDRMESRDSADATEFVSHRDGIPFASNLVALRQIVDDEFDGPAEHEKGFDAATANISTLWTRALRALSQSSPNTADTFHSNTWQRAKCCEYPDGMVDPYPLFWQRMREMALRMESISEDAQRLRSFDTRRLPRGGSIFVNFASTMEELEEIARCQAAKTPLDEEQVDFMKSIMEKTRGSGTPHYGGWYPPLFYDCRGDSCERDVLVTDVHTDYPSSSHGDPGCVLHLGVGNPFVGFFIVNDTMYAGPVFSSYEMMTPIHQRLTDKEFEAKLPWMRAPEWADKSYLCSTPETSTDEEED